MKNFNIVRRVIKNETDRPGCFSKISTSRTDKNYIMRYGFDDRAYTNIVLPFFMQNQGMPGIPEIKTVIIDQKYGNSVVKMKRYEHVEFPDDLREFLIDTRDQSFKFYNQASTTVAQYYSLKEVFDCQQLYDVIEKFIFYLYNNKLTNDVVWDLHTGNIMFDTDKNIFIMTDPCYDYSTPGPSI